MHIEHIAMYVNDLEKARDFFVKYFNAISNEGYHNKTTDFQSILDEMAKIESIKMAILPMQKTLVFGEKIAL